MFNEGDALLEDGAIELTLDGQVVMRGGAARRYPRAIPPVISK
jgi:hypothetical protein